MKNDMSSLEKEQNIICNFVQGELWKTESKAFEKKLVIPLFLYYDDFDAGNGFGSHAGKNKLGGIYTSITSLPSYISAHLNSILLTALCYADDRKEYGNQKLFDPILRELNELRYEGLTISVGGVNHNVY